MTRQLMLRAVVKALSLFFIFNLVYGLINPVETGRMPTLYNAVFPGRVRFMPQYEFDPYRMVSDHVISTAREDTFNIVILGSSEMWGSRMLPDDTAPAQLDRLGLIATDGRPVRVYNLAHPTPYAFRDLIILDVSLQRKTPIDLVLLSTYDSSLSLKYIWTPVARANIALSIDVLERYSLRSAYVLLDGANVGHPMPFFLRLWRDRDALMTWATSQTRGFGWSIMRTDYDLLNPQFRVDSGLDEFYETLELDRIDPPPSTDFLYAFKQVSQETGIPIIILEAPVPFRNNEFAPWILEQSAIVGLPLIDCWSLFRSALDFEDPFHLQPGPMTLYTAILAKHLSDPAMTMKGLPLRLPPDFVPPQDSCTLYP